MNNNNNSFRKNKFKCASIEIENFFLFLNVDPNYNSKKPKKGKNLLKENEFLNFFFLGNFLFFFIFLTEFLKCPFLTIVNERLFELKKKQTKINFLR